MDLKCFEEMPFNPKPQKITGSKSKLFKKIVILNDQKTVHIHSYRLHHSYSVRQSLLSNRFCAD